MGRSVENITKRETLSARISDKLDEEEEGGGKPHVVMIPYPIQGHISPMMELARQLAAGWGFRVTLVTTEHQVKRLMRLQPRPEEGGGHRHDGIGLMGVPDGLPEAHHRHPHSPDILLLLANFQRGVEEDALPALVAPRGPPAALIADSFLLWSQPLANRWHIPRVVFWPNSMAALACSLHLPRVIQQLAAAAAPADACDPFKEAAYDPPRNPGSRLLTVDLPGMPQLPISALPFKTLHGEMSEQWLYEHVREQFRCLGEAHCMIVNSFEALEEPVWQHMNDEQEAKVPIEVYPVGPLLPPPVHTPQDECCEEGAKVSTPSEECDEEGFVMRDDEDCMRWLNTQSKGSVLYIALGTIASLTLKQIYEVVDGLAACKQAFLWVLKGSEDARSEVTIESHSLPGELCAHLRSQVGSGRLGKITNWAPQRRVLAHPAVGAFLSHCGWNSTLESLSCGVPIIGRPSCLDQSTNCWWVVTQLRAGVELRSVQAQEVARVVQQVMRSPAGDLLRSRALQFKLAAAQASSSSSSHLQRFVHSILSTGKLVGNGVSVGK